MDAFVIHPRDKSDVDLLLALVKKIGLEYEIISDEGTTTPYLNPQTQQLLSKTEFLQKIRAAENAPKMSKAEFWKKTEEKRGK